MEDEDVVDDSRLLSYDRYHEDYVQVSREDNVSVDDSDDSQGSGGTTENEEDEVGMAGFVERLHDSLWRMLRQFNAGELEDYIDYIQYLVELENERFAVAQAAAAAFGRVLSRKETIQNFTIILHCSGSYNYRCPSIDIIKGIIEHFHIDIIQNETRHVKKLYVWGILRLLHFASQTQLREPRRSILLRNSLDLFNYLFEKFPQAPSFYNGTYTLFDYVITFGRGELVYNDQNDDFFEPEYIKSLYTQIIGVLHRHQQQISIESLNSLIRRNDFFNNPIFGTLLIRILYEFGYYNHARNRIMDQVAIPINNQCRRTVGEFLTFDEMNIVKDQMYRRRIEPQSATERALPVSSALHSAAAVTESTAATARLALPV